MSLTMNVTLKLERDAAKVLKILDAKDSFKSLELDFSTMSDADLQSYMNPTDADYVLMPVRMLSATGVQGNTINFGHLDGKALKEAVCLFDNLTILKNHVFDVDGWIGSTQNSFWDAVTPGAPPGITGMMKLDKKADPKVVRGLVSGILDSVSVTISFQHDKSHPKMSDMDFYMQLGDVVDGKTVQALVTKVNRVYELSVVWQGADLFAKTIGDDGNIETPGVASSNSHQFSQEVSVDPKKLALALGLTLGENPTEESITAALKAHFQTTAETLQTLADTQVKVANLTTQVTTLTTEVSAKTTELASKTTEVATLSTKVTELGTQATLGTTFLKDTQTEALRLYNLVEATKATPTMQALISSATLEVAQSFITTYKERAEAIAPLACTKCGCTSLSRQSAHQSHTGETGEHESHAVPTAEAARLKASVSSIHG